MFSPAILDQHLAIFKQWNNIWTRLLYRSLIGSRMRSIKWCHFHDLDRVILTTKTTSFSALCMAFYIFRMAEATHFRFRTGKCQCKHNKFPKMDVVRVTWSIFSILGPVLSSEMVEISTSPLVCRLIIVLAYTRRRTQRDAFKVTVMWPV